METRRFAGLARDVRSLLAGGSAAGLGDGPLLERFASGPEGAAGPAFEALVARHGPMVLRVCRGVLRDPHDVDDAFQATFLVLIRRAGSIRDPDRLASWLHGVALRVSARARSDAARRRRVERPEGVGVEPSRRDEPVDDLGARLHREVGRLPDRLRGPVVLCYLEGRTCEDAARLLRCPVGTVKSRLSRARDRLRGRLARLGLDDLRSSPAIPPGLMRATARLGAGTSPGASAALKLAEGVLPMLTWTRWKLPAVALAGTLSVLVASAAMTTGGQDDPPGRPPAEARRTGAVKFNPVPASPYTPRDLAARGGSGTAVAYELDPNDNRIMEQAGRFKGSYRETLLDLRWIVIAGGLDHRAILDAEALARGPEVPAPDRPYQRVDAERQDRTPGGDWSAWKRVDSPARYRVLDNIPEVDFERVPARLRPEALADPLPFLKRGTWEGVDAEEVLRGLPARGQQPRVVPTGPEEGGGRGQAVAEGPEPRVVMLRLIDFAVEPGRSYRYRARVVMAGPGARVERPGPWGGPTEEVSTP